MAYVQAGRRQLFRFGEENDVNKLHAELSDTMAQLNAIRSELRGGLNIMNPGPMARRFLQRQDSTEPQGAPATSAAQQQVPARASAVPLQTMQTQAPMQQLSLPSSQGHAVPLAPSSWAASPMLASVVGEAHGTPRATGGGSVPVAAPRLQASTAQPQEQAAHPSQIPVSAMAAGLLPERQGAPPTGSDVMMDALLEEMVAHQAQAFFDGQDTGRPHAPSP